MKASSTVTYKGETKTLQEWSKITGISLQHLLSRLASGWSAEKMFETPIKKHRTHKVVKGREVKVKKTDLEKRMTTDERDNFLNCFTYKNFGNNALRNKGICQFLLYTGLRLKEFCELRVYDVLKLTGNFKDILDVRAETAKRKKNRQIPLNKQAKEALSLLINKDDMSLEDKVVPVSPRQVREIVAQASIRSGLNRILSPHCLRHDFLSRVYENTKDVKTCQRLAGHSSSKTTMDIYVQSTWNSLQNAVDDLD